MEVKHLEISLLYFLSDIRSQVALVVKHTITDDIQEMQVWGFLRWRDLLEYEMAIYSEIFLPERFGQNRLEELQSLGTTKSQT